MTLCNVTVLPVTLFLVDMYMLIHIHVHKATHETCFMTTVTTNTHGIHYKA